MRTLAPTTLLMDKRYPGPKQTCARLAMTHVSCRYDDHGEGEHAMEEPGGIFTPVKQEHCLVALQV